MTCILQLRNCCNIWSLIMGLRRLDILIVRGFPQAGSLQMNSFCLHSSSLFVAAPSLLWIPGETALAHSLRAYIDVFPYLSTLLIFTLTVQYTPRWRWKELRHSSALPLSYSCIGLTEATVVVESVPGVCIHSEWLKWISLPSTNFFEKAEKNNTTVFKISQRWQQQR